MLEFVKRWWPAIIAVVALGASCLALTLVIPQVKQGAAARNLQLKISPISCKRYIADYKRGILNLNDLRIGVSTLQDSCPAGVKLLHKHGIKI